MGAAAVLSGCGASKDDFVADADRACRGSAHRIESKTPSLFPARSIAYAIDVFQEKDRLLMQLREMNLPEADAQRLRSGWLDPAQRDLEAFYPELKVIRGAGADGDAETVAAQIDALGRAGSKGVDVAMLTDYGLDDCADFFGG